MLVGEGNGKRRGCLCESLLLSGGGVGRPGAGPTVCLHSPTAGRARRTGWAPVLLTGRDGPQSSSHLPKHQVPASRL